MKTLIIEDESHAVQQLKKILHACMEDLKIQKIIDNVEDAIAYLSGDPSLDLIFLDIYLADGISFEIFEHVRVDIPIIFTTAYDEYAIKAFELNSIDYLLKPIRKTQLQQALDKYHRLEQQRQLILQEDVIEQLRDFAELKATDYKKHFLLSHRDRLVPIAADDFAYFEIQNEIVRGITYENKHFLMDEALQELENMLNPSHFFRANRQFLVNRGAIIDVERYFNRRLLVNLEPSPNEDVLVSKARAGEFKRWIREN